MGGGPEVKRPLGRPSRRGEDNIKMHFQQVRWTGMDWIDLAEGSDWSFVNAIMNVRVP